MSSNILRLGRVLGLDFYLALSHLEGIKIHYDASIQGHLACWSVLSTAGEDFKFFFAFGVGAGANVMLRYALNNSKKILGLILVNACCTRAGWIEWGYQKININYLKSRGMTPFTVDYLMWHHFGRSLNELSSDIIRQYRAYFSNHPNPRNLALFMESYLNRTEVILRDDQSITPHLLDVSVLQMVGAGSPFVDDTLTVSSRLDITKSEWAKIRGSCGLILDENPESVTEMILLFMQGFGLFVHLDVNQCVKNLRRARDFQQHGACATSAAVKMSELAGCDEAVM